MKLGYLALCISEDFEFSFEKPSSMDFLALKKLKYMAL